MESEVVGMALKCPECEEYPTYESTHLRSGKRWQFYCCKCKKITDNGQLMSREGITAVWNERVKRILQLKKVSNEKL